MLPLAKVLKSDGTDGGVLLGLLGISLEDIDLQEPVFIEFDGLPVPFFIESISAKGRTRAVARLTDILSLEDAEEIVGRTLLADMEEEDDDEYEDFIGWTVFDRGREAGTVTDWEDIPGNPCLYVMTPDGEKLIPLHEDFVDTIDEENRCLYLSLPSGLLF